MNQLTRRFESETKQVAMYRKDGADYHTLRYVNWLEALVEKFNSEAQSGPTNNARDEMPPSCTECWVIGCQFDYNGVGCRNQVGAAHSPVA